MTERYCRYLFLSNSSRIPCSICAVISRSRSCVVFFCIVGMLHQLLVDRLFCENTSGNTQIAPPLVVRPGSLGNTGVSGLKKRNGLPSSFSAADPAPGAAPRRRTGSILHCAPWESTTLHRFGSAGRSCGFRPPRPDRRAGRQHGSTGRGGSASESGGRRRPRAGSSRSPGQSWRTCGGSAAPLWRAVPASAGGLVHCPYLRKYRGTGADVSRTMVAS